MTPIKAVLFDYGMVLSGPPDPTAWTRLRTRTGLSEDLLHHEYWTRRHAYDRGDLTAETYWTKAAAVAKIPLPPALLDELKAAARRLREAHDRAKAIGTRQAREIRGKAEPRGAKLAKDNAGTVAKAQALRDALDRVEAELSRREAAP